MDNTHFIILYVHYNLPIVLTLICIGSEAIFVHGIRMVSSWMWPDTICNGSWSSSCNTSNRISKFWNDTSPPHNDTWNNQSKCNSIYSDSQPLRSTIIDGLQWLRHLIGLIWHTKLFSKYLCILWPKVFDVFINIIDYDRCDIRFDFEHDFVKSPNSGFLLVMKMRATDDTYTQLATLAQW